MTITKRVEELRLNEIKKILREGIDYEQGMRQFSGDYFLPASLNAYSDILVILESSDINQSTLDEIVDRMDRLYEEQFYPGIVNDFTAEALLQWVLSQGYRAKYLDWQDRLRNSGSGSGIQFSMNQYFGDSLDIGLHSHPLNCYSFWTPESYSRTSVEAAKAANMQLLYGDRFLEKPDTPYCPQRTAVAINDQSNLMKHVEFSLDQEAYTGWGFYSADSIEDLTKARKYREDVFLLADFDARASEIFPHIQARFLVCISNILEFADMTADVAIKNGYFAYRNVYTIEVSHKTGPNADEFRTLMWDIDRRLVHEPD